LSFHGVLGCTVKALDAKVLFDPFEEEFDLPTAFVERADCECWQGRLVGKKNKGSIVISIFKSDAADEFRIATMTVIAFEGNALVANNAGCFVGRSRIDALCAQV